MMSKDYEEHLHHVGTILIRIRELGFTINAGKSQFGKTIADFLEHQVSANVVTPLPS